MTVLDNIVAAVREDLQVRQSNVSLAELKDRADRMATARDAESVLRGGGVKVIAEVKRASPSMGHLAAIPDPGELARQYEAGGAHCISVLTEERFFRGSLADLTAVRAAVEVPLLRKDFVVSSYQLWEARAYGADLVLLIVAALGQEALVSLVERARSIGLHPLVEVHDEEEVGRAIDAGATIFGVNARNLKTLEVDRGTFERVVPAIPETAVKIAESGIRGPHDLLAYAHQGATGVLVGEAVATAPDPQAAVHDLVTAGSHPSVMPQSD